jgi:dTDP-4-amino-4,6-dideoxygalactose transaminase
MIPLAKPYFDEKELEEIEKVLDSCWVAQGPKTKEFEEKIANYLGVKHTIAVSNCTTALHLSLLACGIKPTDVVLVSDFTFPATGHAVLHCGAFPFFVDVNKLTYNMGSVPLFIYRKPIKAIIPVHTFGLAAEMDQIIQAARYLNAVVIEDAACAFGAKYKGEYAGTIGDVGCFSFHARKGITTGEGGAIVTNNDQIAEKARSLSMFGISSAKEREKEFSIPNFTELGYNYKMSDLTAAIGVAQLNKLEAIIGMKQSLAAYWDYKLKDLPFVPQFVPPYCEHVYQSYVVLVDKGIDRDKLIIKLREKGIQTNIGTYASHIQPVYGADQYCPNSLDIYERSLALPMYYGLTNEEIDHAVEKIEETLGELNE